MATTRNASRRLPDTTRAVVERCFDPVSFQEFLAEHWERRPLVLERNEPGRFVDLFAADEIDRMLCSGGLRYPAFRLVKAGAQLNVADYTVDLPWRPVPFAGTADVDRVVAEFAGGATIVIQGLHLHHPPLARFCRALERALGHPTQANAYYTPRGSQGLGVHHDTHDVLCLQVSGEKRWLVYEPVLELPLKDQRYNAELGEAGPVVHDLVLRPGDTLYLPRGWLHEALTSETDSLHLTLGLNVYPWIDAVRAAVDDCATELEFRRAVPDDGESTADLLALLADRLGPEAVARRRRERLIRSRRPIRDRELAALRALDELDITTPVERRDTALVETIDGENEVRLVFEGKEVVVPEFVRDEIEFVLEADGPFSAGDLPGDLDDDGRLVLVRRLLVEGLLQLS